MTDFWSWPGWAGVQGIASLIGVAAVGTAVVDFLASQQARLPEVARLRIDQSRALEDHSQQKVRVTVRVTGPQPLYEARWQVWGRDWTFPDLPPVITPGQSVEPIEFLVSRKDRSRVKIGVVYLVPRRWSPHVRGLRQAINSDITPEVYRNRWWPWWPHERAGRWITPRDRTRYQRRFLWVPSDE